MDSYLISEKNFYSVSLFVGLGTFDIPIELIDESCGSSFFNDDPIGTDPLLGDSLAEEIGVTCFYCSGLVWNEGLCLTIGC